MRFRPLVMLAWIGAPWATAATGAGLPVEELAQRLRSGSAPALILDTRTPEEFAAGHIPGARLVPHDALDAHLAALAPYREREIVLYCRSGRRSGLVEAALRAQGFSRLTQLEGSWLAWDAARLPRATARAGVPQ